MVHAREIRKVPRGDADRRLKVSRMKCSGSNLNTET
jgi:hypothetical protein